MSVSIFPVLDSTGKVPDGVVTDIISFCSFMDFFVQENFCNLNGVTDDIPIPNGNTIAMGNFDECLMAKAKPNTNETFQWQAFDGQWCFVHMVSTGKDETGPREPMRELGRMSKLAPMPPAWLPEVDAIKDVNDFQLFSSLTLSFLGLCFQIAALYIYIVNPRWGQCIPSGCTELDLAMNFKELFEGIGARGEALKCHTAESQKAYGDIDAGAAVVM